MNTQLNTQHHQDSLEAAQAAPRLPPLGQGQGLLYILQFSSILSDESKTKLHLAWWNDLTREYFTPNAHMKLTLWKDNQRKEAKPFEIGVPILSRFFLVTTQSGAKSMSLSLDGARERYTTTGHCIVECPFAVWTYKYDDGHTVTLRGTFSAELIITANPDSATQNLGQFNPPCPFKIDKLDFHAIFHDRFIARNAITGTRIRVLQQWSWMGNVPPSSSIGHAASDAKEDERREAPRVLIKGSSIPGEPVNAFGIPQAAMRCLELAESVNTMTELMAYSTETQLGPLEALHSLALRIRHGQVSLLDGPSNSVTTDIPVTVMGTTATDGAGAVADSSPGNPYLPPTIDASLRTPCAIPRLPPLGQGQGLLRLLQFSGILSNESATKLELTWWSNLIGEYFTSKAFMKLALRKGDPHKEVKTFHIRVSTLPRFFLSATESGVKSMSLSLDGVRERCIAPGHYIVECAATIWSYRYNNGYMVTLRGPLSAHVTQTGPSAPDPGTQNSYQSDSRPGLKFDQLTFDANFHDKLIALDAIVGTRRVQKSSAWIRDFSPSPDDDHMKNPWIRNVSSYSVNGVSAYPTAGISEEDRKWQEPRVAIERCSIPGEPFSAFGIPRATMRCLEECQNEELTNTSSSMSMRDREG